MIVIAENDDSCRTVMRYALEADGHAVMTVGDGLDVAPLVAGGHLDLLILDLRMPGMNGWEVLRALRRDGAASSRAPVIVVSAQCDEETERFVVRLGAAAFLRKPIDLRELRTVVRSVLDPHRPGTRPKTVSPLSR